MVLFYPWLELYRDILQVVRFLLWYKPSTSEYYWYRNAVLCILTGSI
ncbi:hypothetical protein [Myxosarcina sp. GI1]|nr:hypothetical protein [Myxosarcina sp. GI1]